MEIITFEKAREIEKFKPERAFELVAMMNECLSQSQKCLLIIQALIADDQEHIVKFIVCSGEDIHSSDRVLTEEQQNAIDRNMFYLKRLAKIVTDFNDFLDCLVKDKCIAPRHRDWIKTRSAEFEDGFELFQILKRRSFGHFSKFIDSLFNRGYKELVGAQMTGGVMEIRIVVGGVEDEQYLKEIEGRILEKLYGYQHTTVENKLSDEEKSCIEKFMSLLNEITLLDSFPTKSISMYFQCKTNVSQEWLVSFCKNDGLRKELKTLYLSLQPELNSYSNFDLDVSITNSSKIHSFGIALHCNSGI